MDPASDVTYQTLNRTILSQLRETLPQQPTHNLPEFIIYVRDEKNNYFDTSSLQLMDYPTQRPAMFQVASNFNCQENSSYMTNFYTSDSSNE